jgi:SAM-dependent methyltransferase
MTDDSADTIAQYWDTPEALAANKRDVVLKQLEIRAISQYVRDGMRVLDAGCGDGETIAALMRQFRGLRIVGIDASPQMVALAEDAAMRANTYAACGPSERGSVDIGECRIQDVSGNPHGLAFDLVYTERALINLPTWEEQSRAIAELSCLVAPGGALLLCEHDIDGLKQTNTWRARIGLPAIVPPSHNRYLARDEMEDVASHIKGLGIVVLEDCFRLVDFAGMYYFLSRIVNAAIAHAAGVEPDYDAPVNRKALDLPLGPGPGGFTGYSGLWVWRRQ